MHVMCKYRGTYQTKQQKELKSNWFGKREMVGDREIISISNLRELHDYSKV